MAITETRERLAPFAGLLIPPLVAGVCLLLAPSLRVGENVGLALASAVAIVPAIVGLRVAASASPRPAYALIVAVPAIAILGALFALGLKSAWLLPVQNFALVAVGHAVGGGIGRRIEHPGHALPAVVVAGMADVASVLLPSGPSHAIAGSDRALGALALAAPVFGSTGITFVLGAGDLIFAALLLGVAVRHDLQATRVALWIVLGAGMAVLLAATLATPIPALVPIGAVTVAFVPPFRRLAPRDRTTAWGAMIIAVAVVVGLLVRARFSPG